MISGKKNSNKTAKPRGKPFVKGDPRANTKGGPGRPPKQFCVPDILREIGKELDSEQKRENLEVVCRKVFDLAKLGDMQAVNFIVDRTEGKPAQRIETESVPLVVFNLPDDNWVPGGTSTNSH